MFLMKLSACDCEGGMIQKEKKHTAQEHIILSLVEGEEHCGENVGMTMMMKTEMHLCFLFLQKLVERCTFIK